MTIGDHTEEISASVANTGEDDLILGIDWLKHHNPEIDWNQNQVRFTRCPPGCQNTPQSGVRTERRRVRRGEEELNALVAAIEKAEAPSVAEEEAEEDLMQEPEVLEVSQGHPQMAR